MIRIWKSVQDLLPKEGGRFWCYVEELNDLGIAHYQQNVSYHEIEKRWGTDDKVTHWTELLDHPANT